MNGDELYDVGLSAADVDDLHAAWVSVMRTVVAAIIEHGGFAWQLFNGGSSFWSDVTHPPDYNETVQWTLGAQGEACSASLRAACKAGSPQQRSAYHYNFDDMKNKTALVQQLAGFLLMRGNYSWFGYGFQGCSQPYYRRLGADPAAYPGAQRYYERCLSLPLFPGMGDGDVERVVGALRGAIS